MQEKYNWKLYEELCNNIGIQSKNPDGTYRGFTIDLLDDLVEAWQKAIKPKKEMVAILDMRLRDREPCSHPGCLSHISHPCEGCGRIGGKSPKDYEKIFNNIGIKIKNPDGTYREHDLSLLEDIAIVWHKFDPKKWWQFWKKY